LQGKLIDVFKGDAEGALAMGVATAKSYVVPLVCFIVIAAYAFYCKKMKLEPQGSNESGEIDA
jgi:fucose permease